LIVLFQVVWQDPEEKEFIAVFVKGKKRFI